MTYIWWPLIGNPCQELCEGIKIDLHWQGGGRRRGVWGGGAPVRVGVVYDVSF